MQNSKPSRSSSSEVAQKVSPRAARPLKLNPPEFCTASSGLGNRTPKDRSPKVSDRRSPRSPICERKRPSRISELESQISQLQDDLIKVKDQLVASESSKIGAQANAEEVKKELVAVSSKLEESQKHLSELIASREAHVLELRSISEEKDEAWKSRLETVQKQHSVDSAGLASALDEIQKLKLQLEMVAESDDARNKSRESTEAEVQSLREKLAETLTVLEITRNELVSCKESEAQGREMARETVLQLEAAKDTVDALRLDAIKATEAYNCISSELDRSRARVSSLEDLVRKLEAELAQERRDRDISKAVVDGQILVEVDEVNDVKLEVSQLKSALEAAEMSYQEEQTRSSVQIRNAQELVEQVKSRSSRRVVELEGELKKAKADIEELRANLLDKETELQGIAEENEGLNVKLEKSASSSSPLIEKDDHHHHHELLEKELRDLREAVAKVEGNLMDKETELQNISEENEMLKAEMKKREADTAEMEASRAAAEQEAVTKLSQVMEEADKSNKKVARVAEQLEAVQVVNAEMESELRRLKVQSDQWRKAAEAAASMLSGTASNGGKFVERTGSLGSNFSPVVPGRISSPYLDEYDDDSPKKKNGNVLKKIGVLWKKPLK
ncbi:hypothetical protein Dimus_009832 [Dionaea muscipula]